MIEPPSGYAEAVFTCGAMVPAMCGEQVEVDLRSEYYLYYFDPPGWSIDIESGRCVVRCPEHAEDAT